MHYYAQLALSIVLYTVASTVAIGDTDIFRVKLNAQGQFVDDHGRVRMFHGLNSVMKKFPWYDYQIFNETRLKLYSEWGFNLVRLGTMWTGLQPTQTQYNETYATIMMHIVDTLQSYGIYSLLDMHQDVMSSKFSTYDGVPLWLVNKFPKVPKDLEFPFPLDRNVSHFWGDYYATYEAGDAFQSLYSTEIGLESWAGIWAKIVSIFSKKLSIIGYELINEPWIGNFYLDPRRLMPGYAGRTNLLPSYDRIVTKIREIDNDTLVFYEPVTFGSYWPKPNNLGTGFDRVPGGPSQKSKSVLSYHFYCFFIATLDPATNYSAAMKVLCDDICAPQLFKSIAASVKITGGGSLLTEFGGCEPDGNELSINTIECDAVLKQADLRYQSYTYWDSQFFDDNGAVKTQVVQTFARAYPRALQGHPTEYSFDRVTGTMTLLYTLDLNIQAPTEIFLPITVHYKKGFTNVTVPEMVTRFDGQKFLFYVVAPSTMKSGTKISVTVTQNQ